MVRKRFAGVAESMLFGLQTVVTGRMVRWEVACTHVAYCGSRALEQAGWLRLLSLFGFALSSRDRH